MKTSHWLAARFEAMVDAIASHVALVSSLLIVNWWTSGAGSVARWTIAVALAASLLAVQLVRSHRSRPSLSYGSDSGTPSTV
jgi:hypothetical protein